MQRAAVPRPAPLKIDPIRHDREDDSDNRLDDFFSRRQVVGNINPDDLQTLGDLGRGNGGFVTKVKHIPSNLVLAKKVIRHETNAAERVRIMQELEVLKECNSPFIVSYFGACYRNGEILILMEYMDGRSLDSIMSKVDRINEDIIGKITLSVIKGLTYLRDKMSIIHRDIKPSNILVNSHGDIKLCDFGVSGTLINSLAETFVGTRNYMSPERITGNSYSVQSDIWSLGLSLVELAMGVYPIPQHDPLKMYNREIAPPSTKMSIFDLMECITQEPPPTIPGQPIFTEEFKDFVDRCLKRRPEERFDLRTIVQHPFVVRAERTHVDVSLWVCQVCSGCMAPADAVDRQNFPQAMATQFPEHNSPPT